MIYSLLKQNIKSCNAKRRGQRGEQWKTRIGLISKKATLHVQHTFLYISLPLFYTTTTWNLRKVPSYTFNGGNVARVLVHFFFHCRPFSPWWPIAFLIFSPPLQNFRVVLLTKNVSFVVYLSVALFALSFAGLSPTFSFSLPFSFSIFQICVHGN